MNDRKAERLVGYLVMELARDRAWERSRHAIVESGRLSAGGPVPELRVGYSTVYRIERELRELGLPPEVAR